MTRQGTVDASVKMLDLLRRFPSAAQLQFQSAQDYHRVTTMRTSEECFESFLKLKAESAQYDMDFQTEADTRARIISRILHDVLDWPQQNVKREPYANPGYMDYVLYTNKPIAVVEAKRSGDTFKLPPDITKSGRSFLLGGILRLVKNLQEHIDQVAKYCLSNGIEYAIVKQRTAMGSV